MALHSNCTTGDVRLADGLTKYEGRVEVCMNGAWGSICNYNYWNPTSFSANAFTVCSELGYQGKYVCIICEVYLFIIHRWLDSFWFSLWC